MGDKKATAPPLPAKTFSDYFAAVDFYPDLPKKDLEDVIDVAHIIVDVHVVKDFKSKFGVSDFALLLLQELDSEERFTILCGGEVVVKKVSSAKKDGLLPLIGTICKPAHYYDIM